jgi:dipeptidyl aminopeptidase/acylaminoacyl peptidase
MTRRFGVLIGLAVLVTGAAHGQPVPIEDLFRDPQMASVELSPDGKTIAFRQPIKGKFVLATMEVGKPDTIRGVIGRRQMDVAGFFWLNAEDIVFSVNYERYYALGLYSLNVNTRQRREIPVKSNSIYSKLPSDRDSFLVYRFPENSINPNIVKVGVGSLHSEPFFENPGNAINFISDYSDTVRVMQSYRKGTLKFRYRASEGDPWETVEFPDETVPLEFDPTGEYLYMVSSLGTSTMGLYKFDLKTWEMGSPIVSHGRYDIYSLYEMAQPTGWQSLVSGSQFPGLVGVRFETEKPETVWLNPDFQKLQDVIDQTLPDTINRIDGSDDGFRRFVIRSFSDREPGVYHLFDLDQRDISVIGRVNDRIDPAAMSPMRPIDVPTRDDEVISGYLTIPLNRSEGERWPMVVLVHGGPWVRDSFRFDSEVQFLASRGYLVLQINYRGSAGYGKKHVSRSSLNDMDGQMQNDITDAVHWTIDQGFADRERIAIMGWSFGAYSAIHGLIHHPNLYRCGIALSGVYDWMSHFKERKQDQSRAGYEFYKFLMADPEENAELFERISLLDKTDPIRAPVLLVHGERDRVVDDRQTRRLASVLRRNEKPLETLYETREQHGFVTEKARFKLYEDIEAFLRKHL